MEAKERLSVAALFMAKLGSRVQAKQWKCKIFSVVLKTVIQLSFLASVFVTFTSGLVQQIDSV